MREKIKWGVGCVCIPRESYYWLEDWISHYVEMGCDKITIYDNTGSVKGSENRVGSHFYDGFYQVNGISKRGEKYKMLTSHISDEQIQEELKNIAKKYEKVVEIVRWTPKNEDGEIIHNQVEAYADFCGRYKDNLEYVMFFDMDEYLWFKSGHNIQKLLHQMKNYDVDHVIINQRRFPMRWNEAGPNDIKKFKEYVSGGCFKWIGKMENLIGVNLHYACLYNKKFNSKLIPTDHVSFNHYNCSKWEDGQNILVDDNPFAFKTSQEDDIIIKWTNNPYKLGVEWDNKAILINKN